MTRFERKLMKETTVVGVLITLFTLYFSLFGLGPINIIGLRLALSDYRALHFQYFRPAPTDRLVHLDIDDATLSVIGRWPWHRDKMARIIDEINRAGAKIVDLDIILSDPDVSRDENSPNAPPMDYDAPLAASMKTYDRGGRGVLVPMSIDIIDHPSNDPIRVAMVQELSTDLELDQQEIIDHIRDRGFDPADLASEVPREYRDALDTAMFERVRRELESGTPPDLTTLRAKLLPKGFAAGILNEPWLSLEDQLPKVRSFEALLKFTRPPEPDLPPMLTGEKEQQIPIPSFAAAAAYSGFVDFKAFYDATIRTIPLWIIDRNRMVPQMGLSLACAMLGVNPNDLKLAPNSITIPLPQGDPIVIPVHTIQTADGPVGMLMDIPWFGAKNDWETMYDWPNHRTSAHHFPLVRVWDACQVEPAIEDNDRQALEAVFNALVATSSPDDGAKIRRQHPDFADWTAWNKLMAQTYSDAIDSETSLDPDFEKEYGPYFNDQKPIDESAFSDPKVYELILALHSLKQLPGYNTIQDHKRTELREELQRQLSGKAVIIGTVATGDIDFHATPIQSECPGVVVYGVIFNAILERYFIHPAAAWVPIFLTIGIGLLVTAVSAYFDVIKASFLSGSVLALFLFFNFYVAYDWGRTEIDAAAPLLAAILCFIGCTLWRYFREKNEKARITRRFSSYVDPSLVNYMLDHPEMASLKGETRELSVVFTDLAGFTGVSERLREQTVPLLNEYLALMEPVIRRHHGLLNKFLGDGIMFFYGAPEPYPGDATLHAQAAVETVMEMQRVMLPFNESLVQRNLPPLNMRAGVSTGDMVVGDAGTETRSDYTVLGDRVNFASRLESANKYTGTLILISDRTVELLRQRYLVRPIGKLQVVGKKEPVMTYEPLALVNEATDEMRKLVKLTQDVTDSYLAAHFADCLAATHALLTTFGEKSQGPLCALYRRLCLAYLRQPPTEFLGQIKLESK